MSYLNSTSDEVLEFSCLVKFLNEIVQLLKGRESKAEILDRIHSEWKKISHVFKEKEAEIQQLRTQISNLNEKSRYFQKKEIDCNYSSTLDTSSLYYEINCSNCRFEKQECKILKETNRALSDLQISTQNENSYLKGLNYKLGVEIEKLKKGLEISYKSSQPLKKGIGTLKQLEEEHVWGKNHEDHCGYNKQLKILKEMYEELKGKMSSYLSNKDIELKDQEQEHKIDTQKLIECIEKLEMQIKTLNTENLNLKDCIKELDFESMSKSKDIERLKNEVCFIKEKISHLAAKHEEALETNVKTHINLLGNKQATHFKIFTLSIWQTDGADLEFQQFSLNFKSFFLKFAYKYLI